MFLDDPRFFEPRSSTSAGSPVDHDWELAEEEINERPFTSPSTSPPGRHGLRRPLSQHNFLADGHLLNFSLGLAAR